MKKICLLCLICLPAAFGRCNRHTDKSNGAAVSRLTQLLEQKRYFSLRKQLKMSREHIDNKQRLYFQAFTDNAFNRNEACIETADSLLQNKVYLLPDSVKAALYMLKSDSYFKLFRYAESARMDSILLDRYHAALDSEKISDIKNPLLLHHALKNIPPQQTIIKTPATVRWKRDELGLIEIPLQCNGKTYDGIFDTRANISSISQTYAARLGLKLLDVSYEEGSGTTGITFKTGLGMADSLYIGPVLIRHAIFQVMPDSVLYIAPLKFSLNIIIGFPVIEQLEEIHFYKDGNMVIPSDPSPGGLHNLALDALDPVVALRSGNDTLPFYFDSGAGATTLYDAYFKKYRPRVLREGRIKTVHFGGAGGIKERKVYVLPRVNFYLGNQKVGFDSVNVLMEKIIPSEEVYGNIGQDLITQSNELILNFKEMYLEAR